jgi:hypothetical protein
MGHEAPLNRGLVPFLWAVWMVILVGSASLSFGFPRRHQIGIYQKNGSSRVFRREQV